MHWCPSASSFPHSAPRRLRRYFWVIFFHAIAMAAAWAAVLLTPASKPQASASAVALRFYLISTVQWCSFAYQANSANVPLLGINDSGVRSWSSGFSAALAGAVVTLIACFIFLMTHDVPLAHAALAGLGGKDDQGKGGSGSRAVAAPVTPMTGVPAATVTAVVTGIASPHAGPATPGGYDVEAGTAYAQKAGEQHTAAAQGGVKGVAASMTGLFSSNKGATNGFSNVFEEASEHQQGGDAVGAKGMGCPGPSGPEDDPVVATMGQSAEAVDQAA